jgi:hypothetical protein
MNLLLLLLRHYNFVAAPYDSRARHGDWSTP